ncbi:MAG TPA: crotonyl-CoA carboxylase/reductase [Polyangiaceae bacterium]|nr:crotonyl-CoA carboxylase/reductase [Polyangiaceae bacterium]
MRQQSAFPSRASKAALAEAREMHDGGSATLEQTAEAAMSENDVDLVPIGSQPALGVVPRRMHAWVVRKDRYGEPLASFREEVVDTPRPGPNEALVLSMAAGVNYNGVWAGLGKPVSVLDVHKHPFHIAGSDCAGIVWAVGAAVKRWKAGDEVVLHCNQTCGECPACNGYDPMGCESQKIWGYETPYGSFAQFTLAQSQQLMPKSVSMSWEGAASYALDLCTAYRMLVDRANLKPGETVLVWGGAGGLGTFACQIARMLGAIPIAVVSSPEKAELALRFGAAATLNRNDFPGLACAPNETTEQKKTRLEAAKAFGKAFMKAAGTHRGPDVVLEHPGRETFPTSVFLAARMGRIVICAGTSGFDLTFDVRHLWMRQKQILGSHFAHAEQCWRANDLVLKGTIKPSMTEVYCYGDIPRAHDDMLNNRHMGKLSCLVSAPRKGQKTRSESL